ncbi:RNase adapter RapZ [Tessaracoccus sp. MC1865]|uniref:RNase adapter RapZ n=1 Tax=Tessaracoccus sp. MC1865 TaxID=2760310 RepID=UPI001601940F|nr:RNase adapter RapZ [Tessaracoccus sp. MC1865]MBB1483566.1 RNase adapter RapZ [Tessaracoccus sp. MC1865]QTO36651.1 RNase adapter RapZ [Tessaracoccus sp. MC1865]
MTDVAHQEFAIITGLSGAGRRTAAHAMEDLGWFTVDNLPPVMLPGLAQTLLNDGVYKVAVVADVRSREQFEQLPAALATLEAAGGRVTTVFLEADDDIIVQRQESNRRPLPLQGGDRLIEGIARERRLLADIRATADIVVDTTRLSARQLVQRVANHFGDEATDKLKIALISFGFKNGVPVDADMVFDVRFLPNPYWIPELRPKSGLSKDVAQYVLKQQAAQRFQDHMVELLATVAPGYLNEGKRQVTVAIGCTGGKHRSTSMSEELSMRLREHGFPTTVLHRDLGKE